MGLILVFDMDQTILDSSDRYLFERPATPEAHVILKEKIRQGLNWNVVNIMKRAAKLRPDKVSAICLLTNNSSTILVSAVDEVLHEETGSKGKYKTYRGNANDRTMPDKPYFFDSIMMRQHSSRPKTIDNNPPKRLLDIINMMKFLDVKDTGSEVMKDIYFFDDIGSHALRAEFNFMSDGKYKDHYIQITPPYRKDTDDTTDYNPILHTLANLDKEQPVLPPIAKPLRSGPVITRYTIPKQYPAVGQYPTVGQYPAVGQYPTVGKYPVVEKYQPLGKYPVVEPYHTAPPPLRKAQSFQNMSTSAGPTIYSPSSIGSNLRVPPEGQTIHKKPTVSRSSLMNAFKPPLNAIKTVNKKGGSRKTRKRGGSRKNLRLTTRKQKFRHSFRQNVVSSFC